MNDQATTSPQEADSHKRRRLWLNIGLGVVAGAIVLAVVGVIGFFLLLHHYGRALPDYKQLAAYEPPVITRIHAGDGSLIGEFAREHRLFVPVEAFPKPVIHAFLSAEDKHFYSHAGLDYLGIVRAAVTNIKNALVGHRPVGASTITQQVAKNFLLTNEVSYERKIKEAILAYRIERAFTKDQILELYLNEIYLGASSYGVAAAALNYFDKSLGELTVGEMAYLAALPKAPNNYHPTRNYKAAVARRNWVLSRMYEDGHIDKPTLRAEEAAPLLVRKRRGGDIYRADYFTEEVRRELYRRYGEKTLYEAGLSVRTTLEPRLQAIAERVLRRGLIAYDRRHGWGGPLARLSPAAITEQGWREALAAQDLKIGMPGWRAAVVLAVADEEARIGLDDGGAGRIPLVEMTWARRRLPDAYIGPPIKSAQEVLSVGDVIAVEPLAGAPAGRYALRQVPEASGALVALDPQTGRVLALVGGFDYAASEFNRATQALRQPGSAFKPFVYAAALDSGFTPSSLVLDAPFVIDQAGGRWKPENYSTQFYGPSTLRMGIEMSRNLMTVRLAQYIGMGIVTNYADRFGIQSNMQPTLAMALGSGETTVLKLTAAYAMLVNGGKKITPSLIDRIQDRRGKTVYRHDGRVCDGCKADRWADQPPPQLPDTRLQVISPQTAYQVVSMLEGVVQRGTGRIVASVGKPLAGKTGTTNDINDAWFVGFSPNLAVGVYIGFDQPHTLGKTEQGASVAGPIFRDFMAAALEKEPAIPFRIPEGIRLVRVNAQSGLPAHYGDPKAILEAFKPGTEPGGSQTVLDGGGDLGGVGADESSQIKTGTGGLY